MRKFIEDIETLALAMAGTYDLTSSGDVKTPAVAKLWDAKDGSDKGTLKGHTSTVSAIAVMPEQGGDLVTASWDKTIRLWDRSSLEMKKELKGHSQAVWALLPFPRAAATQCVGVPH